MCFCGLYSRRGRRAPSNSLEVGACQILHWEPGEPVRIVQGWIPCQFRHVRLCSPSTSAVVWLLWRFGRAFESFQRAVRQFIRAVSLGEWEGWRGAEPRARSIGCTRAGQARKGEGRRGCAVGSAVVSRVSPVLRALARREYVCGARVLGRGASDGPLRHPSYRALARGLCTDWEFGL